MPAPARKGAYFVSRALTLGKGEGQPPLMGRIVRIAVLLIIPHRRGRKCGAFMNKNKNRLKLSFQPVLFGAADEARTRYLHLGKVALYQMSYGRIKKSPKICSVIFLLAAPVRLERTTP